MGRAVLDGKTTIKEMVDDSFNKWAKPATNDLPEWFLEDDAQHWKPHGPATEEKVTAGETSSMCMRASALCMTDIAGRAEDRARVAAIADRPIKKVAEAKARKKKKLRDRLDKVSTKATAIAANGEMTQQQRVKMISKLYAGVKPGERGKTYMVSTRKATVEKKRTVKGKTKGAVKMVDKRLKKDKDRTQRTKSGPKRKRG